MSNLSEVLDLMNEILACDPVALQGLINTRVECNEMLADHPHVQVSRLSVNLQTGKEIYVVGLMGIINGILGKLFKHNGEAELIAYEYDEESKKIIRFVQYKPTNLV